ncbi:lipase [Vibrio phage K375]
MSDLDNAINSINASAAKAENTATFLDDMSTFDDQSSVTNPNNGQTVASISKQVKDRTDELFTDAESDINQAVSDAAQSATDAQDAADSIGRYQGLWPDTDGSADKGDTYQTQVGGTPTGQYFTALQNTTVDPVGDDVNWRDVVSVDLVNRSRVVRANLESVKRRMLDGDSVKIVCLGDSITEGAGSTAGNDYPTKLQTKIRTYYRNNNITVVNAGVSSNTSQQMLDRFNSDVVSENPDLVIIMAGMNDLIPFNNVSVDQYALNMSRLFSLCLDFGYSVMNLDITPRWRENIDGREQQDFYRKALRGVVSAMGVPQVPMYDLLINITNSKNSYSLSSITTDGTHYTNEGYDQISGAVLIQGLSNETSTTNVGETIPVTSPKLVGQASDGVTWSSTNSVESYRMTINTATEPSNITLFLFITDYEFADLVAYMGRSCGASAFVYVKNISMSDSELSTVRVGGVSVSGSAESFSSPITLSQLRPGYNEINLDTTTSSAPISIDKFLISPRDSGAYFNEPYSGGQLSEFDKNNVNYFSKLRSVQGVDAYLPTGQSSIIGRVRNNAPVSNDTQDATYVFYCQLWQQSGLSFDIGQSDSITRTTFRAPLTINLTLNAPNLDVSATFTGNDGASSDLGTVSYPLTTSGDMHRFRLSQSSNNQQTELYIESTLIATIPFLIGIGDLVVNNGTSNFLSISKLFEQPLGSGLGATPIDGEEYLDPLNSRSFKVIGRVERYVDLT